MSVTFESPSHRTQNNDSYFTPLNMPTLMSSNNTDAATTAGTGSNSGSNTPYFTAPVDPMIHQDFLNAIRARHANNQSGFSMSNPSTPPPLHSPITNGFTLNGGGCASSALANRRMLRCNSSQNNNQSSRQQHLANPIEPRQLHGILANKGGIDKILLLDTRSFVQYSHGRIRNAINISIPNTILKRPTFTMDRIYEAIVQESDRKRLERWQSMDKIIVYDHGSQNLPDNCAAAYIGTKLSQAGYKGQLLYLKGGFDTFSTIFPDECEATPSPSSGAGGSLPHLRLPSQTKQQESKPFSLRLPEAASNNSNSNTNAQIGPFTAPMPQFENHAFNPFFSNIRQNMELAHGPISERFKIRLPHDSSIANSEKGSIQVKNPRCLDHTTFIDEHGHFIVPKWLRHTIVDDEIGPKLLAEMYEKLERVEQRRLQNIMLYHSKHTNTNPSDFPLSIVAGIERGTLNRYTNIWPFEYTRVKLAKPQNDSTDYINASYIQYTQDNTADVDDGGGGSNDSHISQASIQCMQNGNNTSSTIKKYRRYISSQGPLPDTFVDFWQMVWEQNSYVIVMLTKQEEMNKIKCHQYWPDKINSPTRYGCVTITLFSETVRPIRKNDQDDAIIIRQLLVQHDSSNIRRTITQLQYTGWMDFGVPDTPEGTLQTVAAADEAQVLYESKQKQGTCVGPMVVHCSAGCGRSGAFCAIDTVIHRLMQSNGHLPEEKDLLFDTISRFREQRVSMVQTLRQFVFCYETIWWWLLGYGETPAVAMDLND
ncbi:protein-tyrosine phosphatase-like protein [Phascolomyces articulosus]|uniref:protein-tyrosine-phosphatase n=1 Tax=Phascolomyces articulosus TaxID=60185 RepID=A0AAD5KNP9_9FUNG|nr:protein-tyrosine phosphatase-like protein [Phascolomyces articulosus]